ncbi:MAG: hypothetical protein H0T95_08400 [Chthoniobacterales bacterium]|nr:hypothetical protein [Chthoniobacterales bacterium]
MRQERMPSPQFWDLDKRLKRKFEQRSNQNSIQRRKLAGSDSDSCLRYRSRRTLSRHLQYNGGDSLFRRAILKYNTSKAARLVRKSNGKTLDRDRLQVAGEWQEEQHPTSTQHPAIMARSACHSMKKITAV